VNRDELSRRIKPRFNRNRPADPLPGQDPVPALSPVAGQPGSQDPAGQEALRQEVLAFARRLADDRRKRLPVRVNLDHLVEEYHERLTPSVREFLQALGISQAIIDEYQLGFDDGSRIGFTEDPGQLGAFFRGRLIVPVRDPGGRLVELIGRGLRDEAPRYKTLSGDLDVLFNQQVLPDTDICFLSDDLTDALALIGRGYPAVAVPGAANFREEWAPLFRGKEVFIAFENSDAGRKHRERVAGLLVRTASEVYRLTLPEGAKNLADLFLKAGPDQAEAQLAGLIAQALQEGAYSRFPRDSRNLPAFLEEFVRRHEGQLEGCSTGLASLDRILLGGLREGLYVLAGIPASGKTTLLRQMADHVAAQGVPVIFISLEMSAFELWAKSISRLAGETVGVADILSGRADAEVVREANLEYAAIAENLWTVEGTDRTTIPLIAEYVHQTVNERGRPPVVVIDYLQRLPAEGQARGADQRQRDSLAVLGLKRLAREHGCPVVVASTLSRHVALETGLELFREAEAVEQTADVAMALRVRGARTREELDAQLRQDPVPVELEVVKNRNGTLGVVPLWFHKAQGQFTEEPTTRTSREVGAGCTST